MSDTEFEKWLKQYKAEQQRIRANDLTILVIILVLFIGVATYAAYASW